MVTVALAGACGAWARYQVGLALRSWSLDFPWGTLVINTSGCFVLGALTALLRHGVLGSGVGDLLTVGFVGAYTTFSTFSVETVRLLEERPLRALVYVGASVGAGLGATVAGLRV